MLLTLWASVGCNQCSVANASSGPRGKGRLIGLLVSSFIRASSVTLQQDELTRKQGILAMHEQHAAIVPAISVHIAPHEVGQCVMSHVCCCAQYNAAVQPKGLSIK